ncbi:glycosyltransferase 87 family protein [Acrocarpospora macrocephala]|uniref:glycosyltransferase 87 family protein n=1 Tax=Acrocarpospora macrocephala TaxID=150177 RepID=UPI0012D2B6C7|nr:glycosyltransferase 87 family protein [Acrocarpospora macrocephala]
MSTGEPVTLSVRRPWWGWALSLLIIVVAAWPLVAYWLGNPEDQRLVDLDVYRTGGWALLQGLPVYDVITPAPQLLPFTYPPVAAMLAVPLALISWETVQWVWIVAIMLTLGVTVWYAFRDSLGRVPGIPVRSGGGSPQSPWMSAVFVPIMFGVVTVACLYLMPIRDQIRFGQVDLFLVALCLLDCVVRRPWWPRGILIGIATAVKLTPGVFLIYLAITAWRDPTQRKPFFTAAGTTAVLTLLPFIVIPSDATDFWFSALLDSERLGANTATTNQSIRGMLLRLYWPDTLTTILWLAAVAFIGWYGFRAAYRAHRDGDTLTAVALTGLMAVLLSPVAWIHHLAWMIVVIAALAIRRPLLAAGVWAYYVLPIPWWGAYIKLWEIPVLSPTLGKIVQNAFGLGAIALVWVLAQRKSGRSAKA